MIEREVEKLSTEEQHEYYRKKHALELMKEEANGREAQAAETNAKVQFYYDKIDHPVSLNSKESGWELIFLCSGLRIEIYERGHENTRWSVI